MKYMDMKNKFSTWLIRLGLSIGGSDRRDTAAEALGFDHKLLLLAGQLKSHGLESFCMKQLGLTRGDIALIRKGRGRKSGTVTTIEGVPVQSSFNKFAEWAGKKYVTARTKQSNYSKWKRQGDAHHSQEIRSIAKQDLTEESLGRLVLSCFHLYYSKYKELKYKPKNKPS